MHSIFQIIITFVIIILICIPINAVPINNSINEKDNTTFISNNLDLKTKNQNERANHFLKNIPKSFTKNCGQLGNDYVRFYVENCGFWFTDYSVWFEIRESIDSEVHGQETGLTTNEYYRIVLKQEFIGANSVIPIGKYPLEYYSNFFYGNDSSKWCTNVPNYREIYYDNLYENIDLRYYFTDKGLKYDFIVHPGGDPNQIRLKYEGADGLEIDISGNLIIQTGIENLIEGDLLIYQEFQDSKNPIEGRFIKYDNLEYGYELLEDYNRDETLIIDPLIYSSYLGGNLIERSYAIEVDNLGYAYVTGETSSLNFPYTNDAYDNDFNGGLNDIFIVKMNSTGSDLLYATYIGGNSKDYGYDISVDSNGNAYITGYTTSANFPIYGNAYDPSHNMGDDVFVLKLNYTGSDILFSTFIGTSATDEGWGIALDSSGNAYITGFTMSSNFPTTTNIYDESHNGGSDVFVLKLNQDGSALDYSTFIGGSGSEIGYDIIIDKDGNAFVTGYTISTLFPTTANAYDKKLEGGCECFVLELNQTGSTLDHSTFIGGYQDERGLSITLDHLKNVIITGKTDSSDFTTTEGAFDRAYNGKNDTFVSKLDRTLSSLYFSTYIGGTDDDVGYDVAIDSFNNIYITGVTSSINFPITRDAFDNSSNGTDCFILKLEPNGSMLLYSTYIGGAIYEFGQGIDIDSNNNLYITGYTTSLDFPVTNNATQTNHNGFIDAFILKFKIPTSMYIDSISLFEDNRTTDLCYSQYRSYTFRVNLTNTVSLTDLDLIQLNLDPGGSNIQLIWDRALNTFSEVTDPNNYIIINSTSKANNYLFWWSINYNLTFDWAYPDENLHDVQAFATSATLATAWFNASEMYRVENDLIFNGSLLVKGEDNRTINPDSIVRGNETLKLIGLTPIYENSTNIFPNEEDFNIYISDDIGNYWISSPSSGEPFYIETNAPNITYIDYFTYKINISGIPSECDLTNEIFKIKIDADDVSFSEAIPSNNIWQTSSNVIAGITITDNGGGSVNGSTIMQSLSTNDGTTWGDWKVIPGLDSAPSIEVKDEITLDDGRNNLIKWQAMDTIGNGPVSSEPNRILVDTKGVKFSDPWPSSSDVSITKEVELGINISDETSGVNASTIEYAVTLDGGKTWNPWIPVDGINSGLNASVNLKLTFPDGFENMIKWRASDIAGNGPGESPPFKLNVNSYIPPIKPVVNLLSPSNGGIINKTNFELKWELTNNSLKNVTYDLFFDTISPPNIFETNLTNFNYTITDLINNETYYWKVVPKIGILNGFCSSGVFWFKVEVPKDLYNFKINISGPNSISLYPGENKSIELIVTNLGNAENNVRLELEAGDLTEFIKINGPSTQELVENGKGSWHLNITLPLYSQPNIFEIIVTAISITSGETEKVNHFITIEILEPEKPQPPKNEDQKADNKSDNILYGIIGIIIIIIIVLIIILFVVKRRKQIDSEQEAEPTSGVTIKPTTPLVSASDQSQTSPIMINTPFQSTTPTTATQPQIVPTQPSGTSGNVLPGSIANTPKHELSSNLHFSQTPQLPPVVSPQQTKPNIQEYDNKEN